ncbi:hypothetical protein CEE69_29590 [Rhodopirellula bahusiensis]|uniref:Uncharacterized protein n=1 Tax=Rhodopirellula bahusiensis TaxID=2014065 RepID=A0A2G1VY50_9BACT|nr:hypothetical protein CEE69_29590 [Rhodopirellula bahusiensis]
MSPRSVEFGRWPNPSTLVRVPGAMPLASLKLAVGQSSQRPTFSLDDHRPMMFREAIVASDIACEAARLILAFGQTDRCRSEYQGRCPWLR